MNEHAFFETLCAAMAIGLTTVSDKTIAIRMLNFKNSIGPTKGSLLICMVRTPLKG